MNDMINKTTKLIVTVENFTFKTTVKNLDPKFMPLLDKLINEEELIVPFAVAVIDNLCCTIKFDGKPRKKSSVKTIFGFDADEFMQRQYK